VNTWDVIPVLLLILLSVTIGAGGVLILLVLRWRPGPFLAREERADVLSLPGDAGTLPAGQAGRRGGEDRKSAPSGGALEP